MQKQNRKEKRIIISLIPLQIKKIKSISSIHFSISTIQDCLRYIEMRIKEITTNYPIKFMQWTYAIMHSPPEFQNSLKKKEKVRKEPASFDAKQSVGTVA